ncbi:MAG: thioredoxin family protein [Spirochaetales bacterium]|nr:thioredoxin family protein [Spirochaetales bacterium]
MTELNKDTYDSHVINGKGVTVVDFWGETCVRCMQIMPGLEALEEEFSRKALFAKVNIQGNRRLAMREQVMSLPSVLIFKDGERKAFLTGGSFTADDVKTKLQEVLDA